MLQRLFNELFKQPEPPAAPPPTGELTGELTGDKKADIEARNAAHFDILQKFLASVGDVMPDTKVRLDIGLTAPAGNDPELTDDSITVSFGDHDLSVVPIKSIKSENDFILMKSLDIDKFDNESSPYVSYHRNYYATATLKEALTKICARIGEKLLATDLHTAQKIDALAIKFLKAVDTDMQDFSGAVEVVSAEIKKREDFERPMRTHLAPLLDFMYEMRLADPTPFTGSADFELGERLRGRRSQDTVALPVADDSYQFGSGKPHSGYTVEVNGFNGPYADIYINYTGADHVPIKAANPQEAMVVIGRHLIDFHLKNSSIDIVHKAEKILAAHLDRAVQRQIAQDANRAVSAPTATTPAKPGA